MTDRLTRDEYNQDVESYVEEFKNSSGSASHELWLKIRLRKIDMPEDEIDYLVRTNRP